MLPQSLAIEDVVTLKYFGHFIECILWSMYSEVWKKSVVEIVSESDCSPLAEGYILYTQ